MSVKIGICDVALPGAGVFAPRIVHEYGLEGMSIEMGTEQYGYPITRPKLQQYYLDEQQKYGIEYINIAMSDLDYHPIHSKQGTRNYDFVRKMVKMAVDTAAAMKMSTVMVCCFNQSLMKTDEEIERTAKVVQYACDLAGEKGITIGVENALSNEKARMFYDLIDRDNVGSLYDSQNHLFDMGLDPVKELDAFYDLLVPQIHIKDGVDVKSSMLLGTGNTSFYEQMAVLKKHKFEGWLIMENYYRAPLVGLDEDPFAVFQKDYEILKNAIDW